MDRLRHILSQLRVFDAVRRHGGVTAAADQLNVTKGAVSQQIKQLEAVLGVELFEKFGRVNQLTRVGALLAYRLGDIFDRLEDVVGEVTEQGRSRRLRIRASPTFAVKWLMPRLVGFYALEEEVDIDVAMATRVEDVQLNEVDFVVRHGDGGWPDVHSELIFLDCLVPICAPAMASRISGPADLHGARLIHSKRRPQAWSSWFESVGLRSSAPLSTHMALDNMVLCIQAAAEGLGVAIVDQQYLREDLQSGRVVIPLNQVACTDTGQYLVCDPLKNRTRSLSCVPFMDPEGAGRS